MLNGVLSLFPEYSGPDWSGMGGSVGSALAGVNKLIPMVTLGACIAAILALQLFVLLSETIIRIYKLVPFKAT